VILNFIVYLYSIVQTNFSFNGDSSFGSAHGPPSEADKDSLKSVKIEKDQQPCTDQVSLFYEQLSKIKINFFFFLTQPISIKSLIKLEDDKEIKSESNHSPRHMSFSNYSSKYATNPTLPREEDAER
jgi:hypothetical protein